MSNNWNKSSCGFGSTVWRNNKDICYKVFLLKQFKTRTAIRYLPFGLSLLKTSYGKAKDTFSLRGTMESNNRTSIKMSDWYLKQIYIFFTQMICPMIVNQLSVLMSHAAQKRAASFCVYAALIKDNHATEVLTTHLVSLSLQGERSSSSHFNMTLHCSRLHSDNAAIHHNTDRTGSVWVCVCVSMWDREREGEKDPDIFAALLLHLHKKIFLAGHFYSCYHCILRGKKVSTSPYYDVKYSFIFDQ